MQESVFQRLFLGDIPVGSTNLKAGDLNPADVPHGDAAGPVEFDEGAVAWEVGQKEVAHLPEESSMNDIHIYIGILNPHPCLHPPHSSEKMSYMDGP